MYISSTGSKGLHHLVYEVVDRSIVSEVLSEYLVAHPDLADAIVERAIKASDVDRIRKRERDLFRGKSQENDLHPS